MSTTGLQRLETLRSKNVDAKWVNKDLYRLLYKPDLYVLAYERIKSKPGNMTPGMDASTLDGFGLQTIERLIGQMRDESFDFTGGKRVFIPTTRGKDRSITIVPPREKVVQEVIRLILETIYDSPTSPTFSDHSHGFRSGRGTHSALKAVRTWHGSTWIIRGDIESFFDRMDHHVLVSILRQRINDERFINLIWKALRAGFFNGTTRHTTLAGTPQGSVLSPILSNIYLNEFDTFVEDLMATGNKGARRRVNPTYRRLMRKAKNLANTGGDTKEIKLLKKQARGLPSLDPQDPNFARVRYVRYADDWIIAVTGSHAMAADIQAKAHAFLHQRLKLTTCEQESGIRHAKRESTVFLGTKIRIGSTSQPVYRTVRVHGGGLAKRRTTGWGVNMTAPIRDLVQRLASQGFCDSQGKPLSKRAWSVLDTDQILKRYNATLKGLLNYYSFVDNYPELRHVQYILHLSAAKTLAQKHKTKVRKIFRQHGRQLTYTATNALGEEKRFSLKLNTHWKKQPHRFLHSNPTGDITTHQWKIRSRSHLGSPCAICGSTNQVQMHHVRHIRKSKTQRGFTALMSRINRKQVPTCQDCHIKIHKGDYDGVALSTLAFESRGMT